MTNNVWRFELFRFSFLVTNRSSYPFHGIVQMLFSGTVTYQNITFWLDNIILESTIWLFTALCIFLDVFDYFSGNINRMD